MMAKHKIKGFLIFAIVLCSSTQTFAQYTYTPYGSSNDAGQSQAIEQDREMRAQWAQDDMQRQMNQQRDDMQRQLDAQQRQIDSQPHIIDSMYGSSYSGR